MVCRRSTSWSVSIRVGSLGFISSRSICSGHEPDEGRHVSTCQVMASVPYFFNLFLKVSIEVLCFVSMGIWFQYTHPRYAISRSVKMRLVLGGRINDWFSDLRLLAGIYCSNIAFSSGGPELVIPLNNIFNVDFCLVTSKVSIWISSQSFQRIIQVPWNTLDNFFFLLNG